MKTTAKIVSHFDDPVGNWCECKGCNELFFVPTYNCNNKIHIIKYCPQCGKQIMNIEKIQIEILESYHST